MKYNSNKVDDCALALLHLSKFGDDLAVSAWKGLAWEILDRLHEKGFISNPKGKSKSVILTEDGDKRSQELFEKMFQS